MVVARVCVCVWGEREREREREMYGCGGWRDWGEMVVARDTEMCGCGRVEGWRDGGREGWRGRVADHKALVEDVYPGPQSTQNRRSRRVQASAQSASTSCSRGPRP